MCRWVVRAFNHVPPLTHMDGCRVAVCTRTHTPLCCTYPHRPPSSLQSAGVHACPIMLHVFDKCTSKMSKSSDILSTDNQRVPICAYKHNIICSPIYRVRACVCALVLCSRHKNVLACGGSFAKAHNNHFCRTLCSSMCCTQNSWRSNCVLVFNQNFTFAVLRGRNLATPDRVSVHACTFEIGPTRPCTFAYKVVWWFESPFLKFKKNPPTFHSLMFMSYDMVRCFARLTAADRRALSIHRTLFMYGS
jgi:hypothetical protein